MRILTMFHSEETAARLQKYSKKVQAPTMDWRYLKGSGLKFEEPAHYEAPVVLYEKLAMLLLQDFNAHHTKYGSGGRQQLPVLDKDMWEALAEKMEAERASAEELGKPKPVQLPVFPLHLRLLAWSATDTGYEHMSNHISQKLTPAQSEKKRQSALETEAISAETARVEFWRHHRDAAECFQVICFLLDVLKKTLAEIASGVDGAVKLYVEALADLDICELYLSTELMNMKPFQLSHKLSEPPTPPKLRRPPCVPIYFPTPDSLRGMGDFGLAFHFAPEHLMLIVGSTQGMVRSTFDREHLQWLVKLQASHPSLRPVKIVSYALWLADRGRILYPGQLEAPAATEWASCKAVIPSWPFGKEAEDLTLQKFCSHHVVKHFQTLMQPWTDYDVALTRFQHLEGAVKEHGAETLEKLVDQRVAAHADGRNAVVPRTTVLPLR